MFQYSHECISGVGCLIIIRSPGYDDAAAADDDDNKWFPVWGPVNQPRICHPPIPCITNASPRREEQKQPAFI
jgi:hypothetical protein